MAESRRDIRLRSSTGLRLDQMRLVMKHYDPQSKGLARRKIARYIRDTVPHEEDNALVRSIESTVGYYLSTYKGVLFTHVTRGRWALTRRSTSARHSMEDEDLAAGPQTTSNGTDEGFEESGIVAHLQGDPLAAGPMKVEDVVMASTPHSPPWTSVTSGKPLSFAPNFSQHGNYLTSGMSLGHNGWSTYSVARHVDPRMLRNTSSPEVPVDEPVTGTQACALDGLLYEPPVGVSRLTYMQYLGSNTPSQSASQNVSSSRSHGYLLDLGLEAGTSTADIPGCLDQSPPILYTSPPYGGPVGLGPTSRQPLSSNDNADLHHRRPVETWRNVDGVEGAPGPSSSDSYASSPVPPHYSGSSWTSFSDSHR